MKNILKDQEQIVQVVQVTMPCSAPLDNGSSPIFYLIIFPCVENNHWQRNLILLLSIGDVDDNSIVDIIALMTIKIGHYFWSTLSNKSVHSGTVSVYTGTVSVYTDTVS